MWIRKPEFIFLIIAFIFGLILMFVTPPYQVPDENAHLMRACEVADGILYNKTPAVNVECDKYIQKDLEISRPETMHQSTGYSPVMYVFSSLGLNVGKLLGGKAMFYFGRFFNFLGWLIMTALAIRITPVFKFPMLFVALLPMTVYEGMSLSVDAFNNGFSFLFFAFVFKLIFDKKDVSKKDVIILTFMSVVGAFSKGAILPILLFYFLPMKKYRGFFATGMFIISFMLMMSWSALNLTFTHPDLNVSFNKYLLVHEPWRFVTLYAKSIVNVQYYIKSCIGVFGALDIRFNTITYFITALAFITTFFFFKEEKISNKMKIVSLIVLLFFITFLHVYYYLIWTFPTADRIHGIQGRYFIPVLPLVFVVLAQSREYFSAKFQNVYKFILITLLVVLLIYTCRIV